MFIQRLITFTLIVFCGVLLSVKNVCLSEVYDPGSAIRLLPSLLSVHNYNQFFIKTKQEGTTGETAVGTQEALETGSQLVTNRLLTGVLVISLVGG